MAGPFDPKNPDWVVKFIGDLQTAVEMNLIVGDFKWNSQVLQNLINKVGPQFSLNTTAQIHSNAINELYDSLVQKVTTPYYHKVLPGQIVPLPEMERGDSVAYWIENNIGIPQPNESFRLGGLNGIAAGHMTWLICITDSEGGAFGEVGYKYLIIYQRVQQVIVTKPTFNDFPLPGEANTWTIYIALDTGITYYWDLGTGLGDSHYEPIGSLQNGYYISPTEFQDESFDPVTPSPLMLYFDLTDEIYYRWNGAAYLPIESTTTGGGGSSIDLSHLTENNVPRYDPLTGNLENSAVFSRAGKVGIGMAEPTEALEVNGRTKTKAVLLENEPGTPANNTITRNGNQLKHTDETGETRNIATDVQVYKTISGNVTLDDTYHNSICWITANAIITVPSTLRADFNCVFDAIGTVAGTFTEGAGVAFSAPNGKILRNDAMCTLAKRSGDYRLNGSLLPV